MTSAMTRRPLAWAWVGVLSVLSACGGGRPGGDEAAVQASATQRSASAVVRKTVRWSDPTAALPRSAADLAGVSEVVIPADTDVILDMSPPALPRLVIQGSLTFEEQDLQLRADAIQVTGRLQIGSADAPFAHQAIITLTGARTQPDGVENDGIARGLNVVNGALRLYGALPKPAWTQLGNHAAAGARQLTLRAKVDNWRQGDLLAIAPTDYYGQTPTERIPLEANASGTSALALGQALQHARWGRLQYMTDAGISLKPQVDYVPPRTPAPTVLDERAEVANLSRRIVIQGADDTDWSTYGFGAHVMVMGLKSNVVLNGVEIRRAGQAGMMGRYPVHWHLLSYNLTTGALLGDATGHALRNSTIWNSQNRCVVIHGTNGVEVTGNVCHDIRGHAIFLEDAVERRNIIQNNLILKVRNPAAGRTLKVHDGRATGESGSSGLWLTHPDNTVSANTVADAQGPGVWFAFPNQALGLSRKVAGVPSMFPLGESGGNTAHSNGSAGLMLALAPADDPADPRPEISPGWLVQMRYNPMKGGVPCRDASGNLAEWCLDMQRPFTLKGEVSWKNGAVGSYGAYRNQTMRPNYLEWVTADNAGTYFAGTTSAGVLSRGLFVGTSLNVGKGYPKTAEPQAALATYHSSLELSWNTIVNFGYVDGKGSGAFLTNDYYLRPVERGTTNNPGNRLVNSHPGYRTLPPQLQANHNPAENWAIAGALWDRYGYWGPAGNYVVFDVPFLTAQRDCVALYGATTAQNNGRSCAGEYYGVTSLQTDEDATELFFSSAIEVVRTDRTGLELGRWRVEDGMQTYRDPAVRAAYACSQNITPPAGHYCSVYLGHMRHFSVVKDGRYALNFPTHAAVPRWVSFVVTNAWRTNDRFVMSVPFDGRFTAAGFTGVAMQYQHYTPVLAPQNYTSNPGVRFFQHAASLQEVLQDTTGTKIWQDRTNNRLWFRHVGGAYSNGYHDQMPTGSDNDLYLPHAVVFHPVDVCTGMSDGNACVAKVHALTPP